MDTQYQDYLSKKWKPYAGSIAAAVLMLSATTSSFADVRLPALIGDHMVLQQNTELTLWGWADPGEKVTIKPTWSKPVAVTADKGGNWKIQVKTPKAGKAQGLTFTGNNVIEVSDVLLGEVWLASGQSNMEFFVGKGPGWRTGVKDYESELPKANFPAIRMIDVPNTVSDTVQQDFAGTWEVCTPATAAAFSAVAYYFAVRVQQETGLPVGIVNATWGGTPAESWTRKEVLEADADFRPILERYAEKVAAYPEAYAAYKIKLEAWKADTSRDKKGAPKEPLGPNHNKSPYKLYNGMIAPLLLCKFKGVIWYQGESNATYAWQYRKLFPAMISSWRKAFGNEKMPFYFVQIAPHKGQNPVIREAQLYTLNTVPHTGMVVTTDVGDAQDIHPRDKKTVGNRLALWALHHEYGKKKTVYSGPLYRSMKITGNRAVLTFDYAEGLVAKGKMLTEFTIAGKDEVFVPARAMIKGNKVVVWSDEITAPAAVRFAWKNAPEADFTNGAGLPATPFRTDNWPVETQNKN